PATASALLLLLLGLAWTQGSHGWVGTAGCAGCGRVITAETCRQSRSELQLQPACVSHCLWWAVLSQDPCKGGSLTFFLGFPSATWPAAVGEVLVGNFLQPPPRPRKAL
ncbi:DMKN isoform 28, partial [Pan troglodytes]